MNNIVYISTYDLSSKISSGWTTIGIFRSSTDDGVFTEITTSGARIPLLSTSEYYTYSDVSGVNISDYWYKCKLYNVSGVANTVFETTEPFMANTSDLTEDLRNMIGDIKPPISSYRYTIKELRRFIRIACNELQQTKYRYKFKTDIDGIISPAVSNMDKGLILLQAHIEVVKAQMLVAADTNISFSDGRGKFNTRTFEALRDIFKMFKSERDSLIDNYNRVIGNDNARCVMLSQSSGVAS